MITIGKIKSKIHESKGIPEDKYSIYYAGKALESCKTLASLNIENGATLQMISVPVEKVSIIVEIPEGLIKGEVRYSHTPLDVKKIVESIINIPTEGYELFKGRKQLQSMKTLAYYDIKEFDLLKLQPAMYKISIERSCGITFTLEVMQSYSIDDFKHKIAEENEGLPFEYQTLVFDFKLLEDDKNLAFYGIEKGSVLLLHSCCRRDVVQSFQLI